jgi:aspartate/methionine/tyrosine aminotransferase
LIEARSVRVPVGLQTRFQLSADLVAAHWGPQTRGVLVANPGNPTGTLISNDELKAIHDFVRARGGWLLVDEIYHELVYDSSPASAAEKSSPPERT